MGWGMKIEAIISWGGPKENGDLFPHSGSNVIYLTPIKKPYALRNIFRAITHFWTRPGEVITFVRML